MTRDNNDLTGLGIRARAHDKISQEVEASTDGGMIEHCVAEGDDFAIRDHVCG